MSCIMIAIWKQTQRERKTEGRRKRDKKEGQKQGGEEFGGLEWLRSPLILASINQPLLPF